jgi:hypothetical protein
MVNQDFDIYTTDARVEALKTAAGIINNEIDLIEGCRKLVYLRHKIDVSNQKC